MRVAMVGAGAMGGSYGGLLAKSGVEVTLIDIWQEHVDAIRERGLRIEGALGDHVVRLPAATSADGVAPADVVICFVPTYAIQDAAKTVARVLKPEGFVITCQNGIGNLEALQAEVGRGRVLGGSSMASAAVIGAGHVALTHHQPATIGELDGQTSARVEALAGLLRGAGFEVKLVANVLDVIWTKFALNCAINALCATTGFRLGEIARLPELDAFQDRILDEVLEVTARRQIRLTDPDLRKTVKEHCFKKFSRPSMLQHVDAGRRTEIDALNGALVREARREGLPVPYNEALVALLKGREVKEIRRHGQPELDYAAWEAKVRAGDPAPEPPA